MKVLLIVPVFAVITASENALKDTASLLQMRWSQPAFPFSTTSPKHCYPGGLETAVDPLAETVLSDFPIDVVYTWVAEPSEVSYMQMERDCRINVGGAQRFRNLGTFRFSLRLLERHAPWVRKVFVVTDGIFPCWLARSHPKLVLTRHQDIWPEGMTSRDLPSHNSQAIETHLHRIPGLADHFLYMNDDVFIGQALPRSFFFTAKGQPVLQFGDIGLQQMMTLPKGDRLDWCSRAGPPNGILGSHTVLAMTKTIIREVQTRWPEEFDRISATRCRDGTIRPSHGPFGLYNWYGWHSGRAAISTGTRVAWFHGMEVCMSTGSLWYQRLLSAPPQLGCLNDCFSATDQALFAQQLAELNKFMHDFAGDTPSTFEVSGGCQETAGGNSTLNAHLQVSRTARKKNVQGNTTRGRSIQKTGRTIYYDPLQPNAAFWSKRYAAWETRTFDIFEHFIRGKVVLDVGAWIGPTALWEGYIAKAVIALEPTPKAFGEFQANLKLNPEVAGRVVAVNVALDAEDRIASMSNRGTSTDRINALVDVGVRAVSIGTLRKEHPELEEVGFVKIDTEGYERVLVPALQGFFAEKRPVVFVSLHPRRMSSAELQGVVDKLKVTFPYLYETDMTTPFNTSRSSYTYGPHAGADILCTWAPL